MDFYSDISIKPFDKNIPVVASKVVKALHDSGDRGYAIAFPEMKNGNRPLIGRFVRVFHSDEDQLEKLIDFIESRESVSFYVSTKRVKKVPDDVGSYSVFRQLKIKSSNAIEKETSDYIKENSIKKRASDIKEAEKLPFIKTVSNSNKNPLRFSIKMENFDEGLDFLTRGTNGYGLSTSTKVMPLPSF